MLATNYQVILRQTAFQTILPFYIIIVTAHG